MSKTIADGGDAREGFWSLKESKRYGGGFRYQIVMSMAPDDRDALTIPESLGQIIKRAVAERKSWSPRADAFDETCRNCRHDIAGQCSLAGPCHWAQMGSEEAP